MIEPGPTPSAAARRKRRWLFPMIAAIVVVLAGAGIGSYLLLARGGSGQVGDGKQEVVSTVDTFVDMDSEQPDLAAARASVAYGLFATDANGRFRPADPVSRAAFASLVVEIFGLESAVRRTPMFSDVPVTHPDYLAVETAGPYFLKVEGTSQGRVTFGPDDPVSRGEAQRIVRLLAQELAPDLVAGLPAGDAEGTDQPLSRMQAADLLIPVIESRRPAAADTFEVIGVN